MVSQSYFSFTARYSPLTFALICLLSTASNSWAQSHSGLPLTSSASHAAGDKATTALSGYCPVCIIEMKKWVRGNPQFAATFDGQTYLLPNAEIREKFLANPVKYVPALGGDCVVCLAKMGKRMPGSVHHAAYHGGRLFLFPGEDQKKMFVANPKAFANVDLAMDGNCAVCLKEMKKEMPGKPEHTVIDQGLRYQFPGVDQMKMFIANPGKYRVGAPPVPTSSSMNRSEKATQKVVMVTGKSGCAGCDFGVQPIGSDELGLAVKTNDGKVFIVEDAHKLYPQVYEKRFEGLSLSLQGEVVKTDGQFTWIRPISLKTST